MLVKAIKSQPIQKAGKGNIEALIRWAGKVGFKGAVKKLKKVKGISSPEKLAGWLKAQARKRGWLAREHR